MSTTNDGPMRWRRAVTGHDEDGKACLLLDRSIVFGPDTGSVRSGTILALDGPPRTAEAGEPGAEVHEPFAAGTRVMALELAASTDWVARPEPGQLPMLCAYIVVAGEMVVALDDGETTLRPGEVLIVRGQPHRFRPAGGSDLRLVVVSMVPDPAAIAGEPTGLEAANGPAKRVRRVVVGTDPDGRTGIAHDGDPGLSFFIGDESDPFVALADVWETGGPVASIDQGGDAPAPFDLEPRAGGLKVLSLELKPTDTGPGAGDEGWHATATIDVDVVIDGEVELYLPEHPPVLLTAGDILIQRATNHRWRAVGDNALRMVTIMIAVRSPGPDVARQEGSRTGNSGEAT